MGLPVQLSARRPGTNTAHLSEVIEDMHSIAGAKSEEGGYVRLQMPPCRHPIPPLRKEEWDSRLGALIAQATNPLRVERLTAAASDHPVNSRLPRIVGKAV